MTNDKSSQEEKSIFSEKEILIDNGKNSNSIRKKLSPTTYNDEEFNEEENDDFRIASDDDDLSDDKLKKKEFDTFEKFEKGKTEGKEIIGDYDINKGNLLEEEKNKIKLQEGFKLLEKWNDKRNMNDFNEYGNENEAEDNYYEINEESEKNNDIDNNNNNLNKNIILGADKLNLIFNNQKNNKFIIKEDNENDNDNYDDIYTESNANFNYSENENNNNILDKKKNLTYKNKYEKMGSIFDKLEELFDKKKEEKIIDINLDKCKTPLLDKDVEHRKNRVSDFNLQADDYIDDYNENNEIESSKNKKNTYNKKEINMDKYQEIFNNQQQIISKLEILMNKPKSKLNKENSYTNNNANAIFNYNSPKIEFETDSDININKDTPGNRKEFGFLKLQSNPRIKCMYTLEEILSYQDKDICKNISLLPNDFLSHCDSITKTIKEEYSSFKVKYKEIKINNNYEPKTSMDKWERKDMSYLMP